MTDQRMRTRLPLAEAQRLADEVVDLLEAACDRICVAGSIRRARDTIGDIEIVATPAVVTAEERVDLFTTRTVPVDLLDARCRQLRADGTFADRLDKNDRASYGPKYKRLAYLGFPLDVFCVLDPEQWGVILLLRTGPAEFNQRLVLKASQGGWLTRGYFFRDGWLWKLPAPYDASLHEYATKVPTREEHDVLRALGYRYVPPELRGEDRPPRAEEGEA